MPEIEETELVREAKKFIEDSEGADSRERSRMLDDLRFVYDSENYQWDQDTINRRGDRPCYVFNRLNGAVNQVIGDQRQSAPQIKVRGTDAESDPEVAEIFSGLIRNIEDMSDSKTIYDMAFKHAVAGGWGAWRVLPEFKSDNTFDQEIFIKAVHNPFTVYWDPLAQDPRKRDQMKCAIAERISRDTYEEMYGKEKLDNAINIQAARDGRGWVTTDQIRVAEYFKKVPAEKEIALLTDGRVIELDEETKKILESGEASDASVPEIAKDKDGKPKIRKAKGFEVTWWKVDGAQILEGPISYNWQFIPVVKMCGRFINIEGRHLSQSLVRHAKDAQRVYNYDRTTMSEAVGNASRANWLVTPAMLTGFEKDWSQTNSKNIPVLQYNVDPQAPGAAPQRIAPPDVPTALVALAAQDVDDLKATTGFFDASLGERGPQESGEAIRARQLEGDVGSFEFMDNLAKALEFTGEILVDMIPSVYDTERTVRILGLDGKEDFKKINAYDDSTDKKLDLSAGRYDVKVTIGPSYSTQRGEALKNLLDAAGVMPMIAEIAPDLILKNLEVPGADELEKRIRRRLITSGIIEPNEEEQEEIQPQQPDPVQLALVSTEESKQIANRARAAKDGAAAQSTAQQANVDLLQAQEDLVGAKLDNTMKEEEIKAARAGVGQVRFNLDD